MQNTEFFSQNTESFLMGCTGLMIKVDIIDAFLCSVPVSERTTLFLYSTSSTLPLTLSRSPIYLTASQPSSFPLNSLPGGSSLISPMLCSIMRAQQRGKFVLNVEKWDILNMYATIVPSSQCAK